MTVFTPTAPYRPRRAYRGLTLFGALLGLAIGAFAMITIVGVYQNAQDRMKRTATLELITHLRTAVMTIHATTGDYGTDPLNGLLEIRGLIPDSAKKTKTTGSGKTATKTPEIYHPYDGTVDVTGNNRNFKIKLNDLDQEVCASIIDAYVGRATSRSGLKALQGTSGGQKKGTDINNALAATACTGNDDANHVTLTFQ